MAKPRYDKWLEDDNLLRIMGWARDGCTDAVIASNMGISSSTFYEWIKKHTVISDAIKKGREPVSVIAENTLVRLIEGYTYTERTIERNAEGNITLDREVLKYCPPDKGAAIFWLKNKKKEQWSDNPHGDEIARARLEIEKQRAENGDSNGALHVVVDMSDAGELGK